VLSLFRSWRDANVLEKLIPFSSLKGIFPPGKFFGHASLHFLNFSAPFLPFVKSIWLNILIGITKGPFEDFLPFTGFLSPIQAVICTVSYSSSLIPLLLNIPLAPKPSSSKVSCVFASIEFLAETYSLFILLPGLSQCSCPRGHALFDYVVTFFA